MNLLEQIADAENIEYSFRLCLRGKRESIGAQKVFLKLDYELLELRENLLRGEGYPWGRYREFYVTDPKRRIVASAPFIDRVAHRAIYNILEPVLDAHLLPCVYACRRNLGNGRAVRDLAQALLRNPNAFVVKMDIRKYFFSISQRRLMGKLKSVLPDVSADGLLRSLLKSHPKYRNGIGLPLGNLTSQIFSNFYLAEMDRVLWSRLPGRYLRYMDDVVFLCRDLEEARELAPAVVKLGRIEQLHFPAKKRVWLGRCGSVPFLGFLVTSSGATPLGRNRRRHITRQRKKERAGVAPSVLASGELAYEAWRSFPNRDDSTQETQETRCR